jgi:hypothetical protein
MNESTKIEVIESDLLCVTSLIKDKIAFFPIDMSKEGSAALGDTGYILDYPQAISLAANILTQLLGTENPEALSAIMQRIKADAEKLREQ